MPKNYKITNFIKYDMPQLCFKLWYKHCTVLVEIKWNTDLFQILVCKKFYQILPNLNKKLPTRSQGFLEKLKLKLLFQVIFQLLPSQSDSCFIIAYFKLGSYSWQPNFPNHNRLKLKPLNSSQGLSEKLNLKLRNDVIFS